MYIDDYLIILVTTTNPGIENQKVHNGSKLCGQICAHLVRLIDRCVTMKEFELIKLY